MRRRMPSVRRFLEGARHRPTVTSPCNPRNLWKSSPKTRCYYQKLSLATGGYRYPSCESDYTEMFQLMSNGVVSGSTIPCKFALPSPPNGETLNTSTIEMSYLSGGTIRDRFRQVTDGSGCNEFGFTIEDDFIQLCPQTCARLTADPNATLQTRFGCSLVVR